MNKLKSSETKPSKISSSQDTIGWYMTRVKNYSLLPAEESDELFRQYALGRVLNEEGEVVSRTPEALKIRQKLVNSNLRLVISIVKTYHKSGLPMEDLIQEGNIGLMKAIERYDHARGCKFATYATWWIRQAIGQHVLKRKKTIRLPAHAVGLQRKMFTAAEDYRKEFNSEPSAEELAELVGTSEKIVKATLQSGRQIVSLSSPISSSNEETTIEDIVADTSRAANPFETFAEKELVKVVKGVLANLSPKEAAVLRLRFGIMPDSAEAANFAISKEEAESISIQRCGLQNIEEENK